MAKKTVDINVGKSKFSRNQKAGGSTSVQLDCASGKLPFDIAIELPDGRAHAVVRRGRTLPIHQEELFSYGIVVSNRNGIPCRLRKSPFGERLKASRAFAFEIFAGRQPGSESHGQFRRG